jgi:DNA uptake protein ComE-like DNA-binding protein
VFVSRALSPARVMDVKVHEEEKRMHVIVADDQLSLAIGKGGQNARLAAKLTGWKIDLTSKSEEKKRHEMEQASRIEVEKLELGDATTEKLIGAGIETVQELAAASLETLVEIPGIGEKTAEKLLATAQEYLVAHPPAAAPADLEFLPEPEVTATDADAEAAEGNGPASPAAADATDESAAAPTDATSAGPAAAPPEQDAAAAATPPEPAATEDEHRE